MSPDKKPKRMISMKKLFIPPVCVFICLLLIAAFYFLLPRYNLVPFPVNLAGGPIAFFGFVPMGKARDLFRKHRTTLAIERPSCLVTEGIFSKTRNPMYAGMFLLLFGVGICFGNLFSIITAIGFIFTMQFVFIPEEEKLMHGAFGPEYLEYKKKVRRWI
jgi:protein-S-isoprenylcysteine O-methyltransferase Ste14